MTVCRLVRRKRVDRGRSSSDGPVRRAIILGRLPFFKAETESGISIFGAAVAAVEFVEVFPEVMVVSLIAVVSGMLIRKLFISMKFAHLLGHLCAYKLKRNALGA
jgi:hypothetical protein